MGKRLLDPVKDVAVHTLHVAGLFASARTACNLLDLVVLQLDSMSVQSPVNCHKDNPFDVEIESHANCIGGH